MNTLKLDDVWNGNRLRNEKHVEQIRQMLFSNIQQSQNDKLAEICENLAALNGETEKVQLLRKYFQWKSINKDEEIKLEKSADFAQKLLEKADECFQAKIYTDALRGYNLSLMFALKDDHVQLGIIFSKRAALLFKIKEYRLALADINLAARNRCPPDLLEKLQKTKEECRKFVENQQKLHLEIHKQILASQKELINLKKPNSRVTHAEDFVEIKYEEQCGRKLVTTREIKAGTLMMCEEAYASAPINIFVWDTEHCHFCLKPIYGGIPCDDCVFTIYCSQECHQNSCNGYHHYEKAFLSFFFCNHATCLVRDLLTMRVLCTVGPRELYANFKDSLTSKTINNTQQAIDGFDSAGVYDSTAYLPVYHLIAHTTKLRNTQIMSNVFKALVCTEVLDDETDFFSQLDQEYDAHHCKSAFKDYVCALMIHHMESIPFNAISISKLQNQRAGHFNGNETIREMTTVSYGMGLYSLLCLCNHSCEANVIPLRSPNSTRVSVVALRNLKEGEELCISYGPSYHNDNTLDRQQYLEEKYKFLCACAACKNDWCPESYTRKSNLNGISVCELHDKCGDKHSLEDQMKFERKLEEARVFVNEGKFIDGLVLLRPCLVYFSEQSECNFQLNVSCQELYKLSLVWLFNSHSSCFCEKITEIVDMKQL